MSRKRSVSLLAMRNNTQIHKMFKSMHHVNICFLIKIRSIYSPTSQMTGTWEKHISVFQHTCIQK